MRIACPNCSAEYDVPESALAAGPRLLRCARCGHQFQAALPAPPPEPAPPDLPPGPAPGPPPGPPPEPPRPRPSVIERAQDAEAARPPPTRGPSHHSPIDPPPPAERLVEPAPSRPAAPVALAWLLSLAVLGAAGWAGYRYRAEIVEAWPPAARLYAAIGLH